MMIQTPAPLPPTPPVFDPFIFGRVQETVVGIVVTIAIVIVAIKVLGPLARAWARKLEGRVGDPELRAEVEHLREQLGDVDGLRSRIQELEERVEFAERLLSQKRDQDMLPRGGGL